MNYIKQAKNITTLAELKKDILYQDYLKKLEARNRAEYEFGFVPNEYNRELRELEGRLISHISPDALWTWESGGDGNKEFLVRFETQDEDTYVILETPWSVRTYTVLFDHIYPNGYRRIEVYDFNGKSQTLHLTLA